MDRRLSQAHLVSPDVTVPNGETDVRSPDVWRRRIARVVGQVADEIYGSRSITAEEIDVDDGEFGKWCNPDSGRRPQLDRLLADDNLRTPTLLGLVSLDPGLEVVIQVRRVERRRGGGQ